MELEHGEITEKIVGAAFEVYNVLGYGFLETVYKKALQVELQRVGCKCEIEKPIQVKYKQAIVGDFRADLLVNDVIIVELKIAKQYNPEDEPQLLNELKANGIKVGLLINFGRSKVEFQRRVY
jgi:GxxExxY protein